MTHPFWGRVEQDWAGFSGEKNFSHPFFESEAEIFLGYEFTEELEEIDTPPTRTELDNFADTYKDFVSNFEKYLAGLQQRAFEYYRQYYAGHYENSARSGEPSLNIDTVEKHNSYLKDLMYLRITDQQTIRITIRYKLDTEHGLEFKFADGQIEDVGGIADT